MTAPRFRTLDWLVLVVEDLERSVVFYRDVLGIEFSHSSGGYAQFSLGPTRLGLFRDEDMAATLGHPVRVPDRGAAGFELGFAVEDVDATFAELVAAGAEPVTEPADRPWGQRTAYVADPDGYLIELVTPLG